MFLLNYLSIFIFFIICVILAVIIFFIPYLLSEKLNDKNKLSSYECGFNPFCDTHNEFDIKFYIVAILFIIFDLEISFLFPWAMTLGTISAFGFWTMAVFLIILTVGFVYEWKKGALDWE